MVEVVTSLGRNGLQDWLVQRVSAVMIATYALFLVGYLIAHPDLSYADWQSLFMRKSMRYSTLLVLLSLLAHAWIGFWTINTDYIKNLSLRLSLQFIFMLTAFCCLIFGIRILWRI